MVKCVDLEVILELLFVIMVFHSEFEGYFVCFMLGRVTGSTGPDPYTSPCPYGHTYLSSPVGSINCLYFHILS